MQHRNRLSLRRLIAFTPIFDARAGVVIPSLLNEACADERPLRVIVHRRPLRILEENRKAE